MTSECNQTTLNRPKIGFFVHHQGAGHAKRCQSIIEHLGDCEITVFSASREHFTELGSNVTFVLLPDMIAAPARVTNSPAQTTPTIMHCVPLGVKETRETFGLIAQWALQTDPHLLFIDVSAELALFARILSVPAVKVRMHGDRSDPAHNAAYQSCAGLLAPYNEAIEEADYPRKYRPKTFYSGGLCTTKEPPLEKLAARRELGLSETQEIILSLNGAGGKGTSYASLTLGARARPDACWITIGQVYKEGHETDFPNLQELGWVLNGQDYIAAADVVIASGGDNTVTEIARSGRPFICIPEWRYFDEQLRKAKEFARHGAAVVSFEWPGTLERWNELIKKAYKLELTHQRELFDPEAARRSARYLRNLVVTLWEDAKR